MENAKCAHPQVYPWRTTDAGGRVVAEGWNCEACGAPFMPMSSGRESLSAEVQRRQREKTPGEPDLRVLIATTATKLESLMDDKYLALDHSIVTRVKAAVDEAVRGLDVAFLVKAALRDLLGDTVTPEEDD